jgi:ubiquitin-protein ligase
MSTRNSTNSANVTHLSKITIGRLISDIKKIRAEPLEDSNIYYRHDEENILRGYAMIVGYKGTPYEYGYYLFEFNFPTNYPFSPPSLVYSTNDGSTRFNPNLYINGKVCLSVLNTWKGEQWTSCQTISSILLTLATILNDKPLVNEPGISETHRDFEKYNKIIRFKNYQVAIMRMLKKEVLPDDFGIFYEIMCEQYKKNKGAIIEGLTDLSKSKDENTIISTGIYNLQARINYERLLEDFNKLDV